MKILDVRLRNLNSLRGEWHIDLTDKVYSSNGIFAITGPTGAGKTTIFDAICLALYGRTSRLTRVNKSTNEIISIGENECFAQVTFETEKGKFTCKWGQSREKGELQQPTHHLSDENTHIPLTSQTQKTQQEIIKLTGMDFMRFTRAMMLEQGNFDKFLKADKNERAEILEMITGTEIYSEISRRVFLRSKDEEALLSRINVRLGENKNLISSETEDEINTRLEAKQAELLELDLQHSTTKTQREILREIRKLDEELRAKQDEITIQTRRLDEFEHDRKILEAAERAQDLMIDYSELERTRADKRKSAAKCQGIMKDIEVVKGLIAKIDDYLPQAQDEFAKLKGDVTEPPDAVREKIKSLVENYTKADREKQKLKNEGCQAKKIFEAAQANLKKKDEARENLRKKVDEAAKTHGEILDALMESRAKTASAVLDEERVKLQPGQPCPLCGSTEHPGITHPHENTEKSEELFRLSEKLDEKLKRANYEVDRLRVKLDQAEREYSEAIISENEAESSLDKLRTDWQAKHEECKAFREEVMSAVTSLKIEGVSKLEEVNAKIDEWVEKLNALDKNIQEGEKRKSELSAKLETLQSSFTPERENLDAISSQLETLENNFILKLKAQNFIDEKNFTDSCIEAERLAKLQRKREELNTRMTELMTLRDDVSRKLDEKRKISPEQITLEEAESLFADEDDKIKALNGDIAVLTQKLNDRRDLQGKIDDLARELEAQKVKAEKWAALNELIGSSSGDKLRVFAQKITLELVVKNANSYLQKMNGRYRLMIRPDNAKLELSVIDSEQAGEIRPTENLSGGERFIISLALALGLSQISGSKARVDSLFLDEGFGTLDEESMNTALEALGEVKREGRMIGIISHVQALKERIAAQIKVIPKSEGVSVIEGPGCSSKI